MYSRRTGKLRRRDLLHSLTTKETRKGSTKVPLENTRALERNYDLFALFMHMLVRACELVIVLVA
jgi:hypothetical protein